MSSREISEFRKTFGPHPVRSIEPSYYQWKIDENPFLRGRISLEQRDGKVVSAATIVPKRLSVFGETVLGAETGDNVTDPTYRRQGLFTKVTSSNMDYAQNNGIRLVYGLPNDLSLQAYEKRLNFSRVPHIRLRQLHRYNNLAPYIPGRPIRPELKKVLTSIAKRIPLRPKAPRLRRTWKGIATESIERFEGGIDDRWGKGREEEWIFILRDATYLNWRFVDNPDTYEILGARGKNRELCGYIVGKVSRWEGLRKGTICDFITFGDDPNLFAFLLDTLEQRFVEMGVSIVATWCVEGGPYWPIFQEHRYKVVADKTMIVGPGALGSKVLQKGKSAHFTMADSDDI